VAGIADEIALLRGTRPATLAGLFKIQSFNRLLRAMTVSSLGDWVGFIAVTDLVRRLGGARAGFAITGVMLARLLPSVVFGPFAGVLVDRIDRKKLMMLADITRGVGYASMPFLGSLTGIYVLSFALECMSLLWTPARDASLPNLVPRRQLTNANSLSLMTSYGTLPIGGMVFTGLAALSLGLSGRVGYFGENPEALALWLNGLTFAFSAYMVWGLDLKLPRRRGGKLHAAQAWEDLVEGVRFLREHRFQRTMTVSIVLAFIGVGSVIAIGPIFAGNTLGSGTTGWGILVTAVGVGLGLGMFSLGFLERFVEKHTLFPLALVSTAGMLVVLAMMPNLALASAFTVVMGAGTGIAWVTGYTMLQEHISDDFRGRTFATLTVLVRLGLLASLAGFPAIAETFGDYSFAIGGQSFDLSGTRLALGVGALVALSGGLFARRGLRRSRVGRTHPLTLRPDLRRGERPGTFIAFEGVEGSGKGTQVKLAREFLESKGFEVLVTREPGGTDLGEKLREVLLERDTQLDPRAEALLFAAARAQHVASVIRTALEKGKVVICDRYVDSSLAYQGHGRGLGEPDILTLSAWATQGLFPDLVLLLDVEAEEGLARAGDEPDRFESENLEFHERVAEAYRRIAGDHPERFVVVEAAGEPGEVHARVREALERFLKLGDGES